jgi:tyrosine-protein kinase Etk/Wzc
MATTPPLDLIALLLARWRTIAILGLFGTAAGVAYALLAPSWYSSSLAVVQSDRSKGVLNLAARLPEALDTGTTDVERIEAVFRSNSVTDEVIDKFDLSRRYERSSREQTRAALWEHCSTHVNRKSSVVTLTCEDQDPKFAMELASFFGEVGNRVFGRVSASSAREERRFLETQVEKARADVDQSSQKLREYQEQHKLVDLPEQSKAVISAMASMQGELLSKQLELSYLTSFSSRGESSVIQLQQQIAILKSKLGQLENSNVGNSASGVTANAGSSVAPKSSEFFPNAMAVPALRFELEQLLREQKIRETVFFLMTQRFEMARADEARDTSTFQILDYPTLPTTRSRPQRRQLVMLGFALGVGIACAWILLPVWWRRRRRLYDTHPTD